ncbi:hypothetical protein VNO78_22731 [Psophocarpus tetragonolobus]|uniref:Uncharacterized protein n=1 Tax=Psophocarpus tetragonolobus TaxID=3891 RepID=A0AAN9S2H5_PSOTE
MNRMRSCYSMERNGDLQKFCSWVPRRFWSRVLLVIQFAIDTFKMPKVPSFPSSCVSNDPYLGRTEPEQSVLSFPNHIAPRIKINVCPFSLQLLFSLYIMRE